MIIYPKIRSIHSLRCCDIYSLSRAERCFCMKSSALLAQGGSFTSPGSAQVYKTIINNVLYNEKWTSTTSEVPVQKLKSRCTFSWYFEHTTQTTTSINNSYTDKDFSYSQQHICGRFQTHPIYRMNFIVV